jgi:hypothetical protein
MLRVGTFDQGRLTRMHRVRRDVRLSLVRTGSGTILDVTAPHLTTVAPTDWTMLRAIARRVLCVTETNLARHPSNDEYWEVQRSALRLASYLHSGEMAIQIVLPELELDEIEISICFDDGLEPIVVPWSELDFVLEPAPRLL